MINLKATASSVFSSQLKTNVKKTNEKQKLSIC